MRKGEYQPLLGILIIISLVVLAGLMYHFSFKPKIETNQTTTASSHPPVTITTTSTTTITIGITSSSSTTSTTQTGGNSGGGGGGGGGGQLTTTTSATVTSTTETSSTTTATTSTSVTTPIYSTDFENVTLLYPEPHNDNWLNMGIPNSIVYQNYVQSQPGGATVWMEGLDRNTSGITCHSGTRCLGMELFNITKSRRNEFNIVAMNNLTGNQGFVSVWLYLPANWQTYAPSGSSWYALVDLYFTPSPNTSWASIYIVQTPPSHNFEVEVAYYDTNIVEHWLYNNNDFPLPVGRWFNVQWYVLRSTTNGRLAVWLDGQLLEDTSGFNTGSPTSWFTTPGKIYYNQNSNNTSPYYLWVDDLQIYSRQP